MPHAVLIDDNPHNMTILAQLLAESGVSSTLVADIGKLADTIAALDQIDLIFLDLEMPQIDGYSLLEHLRAEPRLSSIPVVAHTVYLTEITTAAQVGFHSFIGKPIDADTFPQQLARILRGERVWENHR